MKTRILLLLLFASSFIGKPLAQNYSTTHNLPISTISGTGTPISAYGSPLPIGFSFSFWGTPYTEFYLNPYGAIQFGVVSNTPFSSSSSIPSSGTPNNLIAFAWGDTYTNYSGGNMSYFTTGTAPYRKLVLNYKDVIQKVKVFTDSVMSTVDVQVQLYEGSNNIEIHNVSNNPPIKDTPINGLLFATRQIGIENNDGSAGVPITTYYGWDKSNTMVRLEYCASLPNSPTDLTPSQTFCSNEIYPTYLEATCDSGNSPVWYLNGSALTNTTVSPAVTSTYTVYCETGGEPNCRSTPAYTTITINEIPSQTPVLSANPSGSVNEGQPVAITASGCPYYTYVRWYDGSTTLVSNFNNPVVSRTFYPTETSTYTAQCMSYSGQCTGAYSNNLTVNVITPPTLASNAINDIICNGVSVILTAGNCFGGTISWNNGLGTGFSKTVNPTSYTVYTVTCSITGLTRSLGINVNYTPSQPTAITQSPTGTQLPGTQITLSSSCTNGDILTWENNSTASPRIVQPTATTSYSATCKKYSCSSPSQNITVDIDSPPIISSSSASICTGAGVTLTATGCNSPHTVTWSHGATGTMVEVFPPSLPANYTATCTRGSSVSGNSNIKTINSNGGTVSSPMGVSVSPSGPVSGGTALSINFTCASGNGRWASKLSPSGIQDFSDITFNYLPANNLIVDLPTTYAVKCEGYYNNCSSPIVLLPINVTVQEPVITSASPMICGIGNSTTLNVSGCSNGTIEWTVTPSNSPVPTDYGNGSFSTGEISQSTSYTAKCVESDLTSSIFNIPLIINSLSDITYSTSHISSFGQSLTLSATCNGAIEWLANYGYGANGELGAGASVNVIPTKSAVYTAKCIESGCFFWKNSPKISPELTIPTTIGNPLVEGIFKEGCGTTSDGEGVLCLENSYTFMDFDAGTYYFSHNVSSGCGGYFCKEGYFIYRNNGTWKISKWRQSVSVSGNLSNTVTPLYHTQDTFTGNYPPCNAIWINDTDEGSQTINISGICLPGSSVPCPMTLTLASSNSPSDDINSGTVIKKASSGTGGKITAGNKITGTANVIYQATSIELIPGFKAENGTVFKAETGGCL